MVTDGGLSRRRNGGALSRMREREAYTFRKGGGFVSSINI